jgi:hypothetical protein
MWCCRERLTSPLLPTYHPLVVIASGRDSINYGCLQGLDVKLGVKFRHAMILLLPYIRGVCMLFTFPLRRMRLLPTVDDIISFTLLHPDCNEADITTVKVKV